MLKFPALGGTAVLCLFLTAAYAQAPPQTAASDHVATAPPVVDSVTGKVVNFPSSMLGRIQRRTASLDQQLTKQTASYLTSMSRREARLRRKLAALDTTTEGKRADSANGVNIQKNYR